MTSPVLAPSPRKSRGFTLTEIVVVAGILLILAGILLSMGMKAFSNAGKARDAADLQAIAVALDAYKADMGDYPRLPAGVAPEANTGAGILGKALYGPGESTNLLTTSNTNFGKPYAAADEPYAYGSIVEQGGNYYMSIEMGDGATGAPPSAKWVQFDPADNADGLGFRTRMTGGGKSWGPYLQEGKFDLRGTTILDRHQNPILYFPGNPSKPNIRQAGAPGAYVAQVDATAGTMYNANANINAFVRMSDSGNINYALTRIRVILGDYNPNGYIDSALGAETEATTAAYLLWSAGADREFGPTDIKLPANVTTSADFNDNRAAAAQCDDVTNFR